MRENTLCNITFPIPFWHWSIADAIKSGVSKWSSVEVLVMQNLWAFAQCPENSVFKVSLFWVESGNASIASREKPKSKTNFLYACYAQSQYRSSKQVKCDLYHICNVQENRNVKRFCCCCCCFYTACRATHNLILSLLRLNADRLKLKDRIAIHSTISPHCFMSAKNRRGKQIKNINNPCCEIVPIPTCIGM